MFQKSKISILLTNILKECEENTQSQSVALEKNLKKQKEFGTL